MTRKSSNSGKETILLTGATGSLGTALLEVFSALASVEKVFAMVRGNNPRARLKSSLEEKGFDASILSTGKVEVLPFSMRNPLLGLNIDTYHKLTNTVTTVIQNAWKMDFNLSVTEFENDWIFNTMSLIRFAHAGIPKTFAFTSSISTCMGSASLPTIHETPIASNPELALATGYAQSKFIIERVTQTASSLLGIKTKLLRVGQMCGHTRSGRWNKNEMWPIMFATSAHEGMRCVPRLKGMSVDWIPVDVCAAVMAILLPAAENEQPEDIYTNGLGTTEKLEELSMTEWTERLGAVANKDVSPDEVPGLRLLGFFEDMAASDDGIPNKVFETHRTQDLSNALRSCEALNQRWMNGNVRAWRASRFLK